MSGKATTELANIRQEIENDIKKLRGVRDSIGNDLRGLGGERCVSSINLAIKEYKKSLEWIDKLKPVAKAKDEVKGEISSGSGHGGGGSSGGGFGGGGGGGHGF